MEEIRRYGYSYPDFKKEIANDLKSLCKAGARVLDIGAGEGIYYELLKDYYILDAVEVCQLYIEHNKLKEKYSIVYEEDIRNFSFPIKYDIIIMGDILEHLFVEEAQKVIRQCQENCNFLMVAIPYQLAQDAMPHNPYEAHHQPDLTDVIFNKRYPNFKCLYKNRRYGYYLWRK